MVNGGLRRKKHERIKWLQVICGQEIGIDWEQAIGDDDWGGIEWDTGWRGGEVKRTDERKSKVIKIGGHYKEVSDLFTLKQDFFPREKVCLLIFLNSFCSWQKMKCDSNERIVFEQCKEPKNVKKIATKKIETIEQR